MSRDCYQGTLVWTVMEVANRERMFLEHGPPNSEVIGYTGSHPDRPSRRLEICGPADAMYGILSQSQRFARADRDENDRLLIPGVTVIVDSDPDPENAIIARLTVIFPDKS